MQLRAIRRPGWEQGNRHDVVRIAVMRAGAHDADDFARFIEQRAAADAGPDAALESQPVELARFRLSRATDECAARDHDAAAAASAGKVHLALRSIVTTQL